MKNGAMFLVIGLFGAVWLSVVRAPAAEGPEYRAGLARVCITPKEPLWLAGYSGRRGPSICRSSPTGRGVWG